jgi:hypothetical protein
MQLTGVLFATVIIFAIAAGNAYVYYSFQSTPNLFPSLAHSAAELPSWLVTTIFSPTFTVLNGSQTFAEWYLGFVVPLVVLFIAFLVTDLGVENREMGLDCLLYGTALFVIPICSNAFALLTGQYSAGPLTVTFTSIGLVVGFNALRVYRWIERGRPSLVGRELALTILSFAIVGGLILAAALNPIAFFNTAPVTSVGWVGSLFCLLFGAAVPIWFHSLREA